MNDATLNRTEASGELRPNKAIPFNTGRLDVLLDEFGIDLKPFNIEDLIPRMIRGVAGCEGGCPSDAMRMVREGFGKFKLEYVEGGILTAVQTLESGKPLEVKIFPDFD